MENFPCPNLLTFFLFLQVVLASSSKFFRDLFRSNASLSAVDLDRELSPNGLSLSIEDVRLIIGILYCVGTVEISPQRIESLLVSAQVRLNNANRVLYRLIYRVIQNTRRLSSKTLLHV
jgi:hypothetical protein